MTQPRSKSKNIDKGGVTPADVIKEMLDIHRKSHHFSISKTQPKIMVNIEVAVLSIPIKHLKAALEIFKTKTDELGKSPHPNYFLKVANRLYDESLGKAVKDSYIKNNTNLGKSI